MKKDYENIEWDNYRSSNFDVGYRKRGFRLNKA